MQVRLISKTVGVDGKTPQELIGYCARVSNPSNQDNPNVSKLLQYCFKHGHVSIFEMADFTFEIKTSRAIAAQILRHRHFNYQEFSQRYSEVQEFETYDARMQDPKNKQNSLDNIDPDIAVWFFEAQEEVRKVSTAVYKEALRVGIAKEQARFLLPMTVQTTMYMKGSLRSWIHYLAIRRGKETQKEHREIAEEIYKLLMVEAPDVMSLLPEFNVLTSNPYD